MKENRIFIIQKTRNYLQSQDLSEKLTESCKNWETFARSRSAKSFGGTRVFTAVTPSEVAEGSTGLITVDKID